jgi:hypothetical protein
MAIDDDRQRILSWCSAGSDVRYVEEVSEPGAEFSLVLESGGVEMTATLPAGSERINLINTVDLGQATRPAGSGDLAADLADLEERRPGPVTVSLDPTGGQVEIGTWIVVDGLSKHSLLTSVSDLVRTRGAVLRLVGLPADVAAPVTSEAAPPAPAEPEMVPVATPEPVAQAVPGWAWPPVTAGPEPEDAAAPQAPEEPPAAAEEPAVASPWASPPAEQPTLAAADVEQPAPISSWSLPATPVEEPAPATPSPWATPVEEPAPAAPSPWATPAAEEPAPAAASPWAAPDAEQLSPATPVGDEQPAAPSPWAVPAPEQSAAEAPAQEEPVATPGSWGLAATPAPETAPASPAPAADEQPAAPSPWAVPAAEQSVPATPAPVEQPAATNSWSTPAATTFEAMAPHQELQSTASTPTEFVSTPGPIAAAAGLTAGSAGAFAQPYTAPAPAQPPWTPSHRVPPQGMQAWAAPDPAGAVVATLGGHLPVQVTEVRGAWAHVLCSNGWTGWVDDRLLIVGA